MEKKRILSIFIVLLFTIFLRGQEQIQNEKTFIIAHIPAEKEVWDCFLIADNLQSTQVNFTLELYDEEGNSVLTKDFSIPAFGYLEINLYDSEFPNSATGKITTDESFNIAFRIAYQNKEYGGIAEFPLTFSSSPMIAFNFGNYNESLTWKGLAVANTTNQKVSVSFLGVNANGEVLGIFKKEVSPFGRISFVLNSNNAFGENFPWKDCVRVYASSVASLAGLNISGIENDKLLFSQAVPVNEVPSSDTSGSTTVTNGDYVVIAWNDLGMHCYDDDFSVFSILPPYNTLWAQVIKRGTNPEIITDGITVEYSFENNTTSVGKTNFWDYEDKLFGVNLQPDTGLKAKTLSDTMDPAGDHFIAEGIPLTQFNDDGTTNYYQTAIVTVKAADGTILAQTRTVAPVSNEMHCSNCHQDNGVEGIATGNYRTNILTLHDMKEGTSLMQNQPVLCASCHPSNALGTTGNTVSLSHAIHNKHKDKVPAGINGCYNCHPGPNTQCLRGVMFQEGQTCTDCHGTMADVADQTRNPWLDEPNCGKCHEYGTENNQLYRMSKGHGGMYCESCHGSPHAILPSGLDADNQQNIMLQGKKGTLSNCSVCHTDGRTGDNPHEAKYHPDGWEQDHGDYVEANGYTSCAECHGEDYTGGTSGVSCYQCHNGPDGGDD